MAMKVLISAVGMCLLLLPACNTTPVETGGVYSWVQTCYRSSAGGEFQALDPSANPGSAGWFGHIDAGPNPYTEGIPGVANTIWAAPAGDCATKLSAEHQTTARMDSLYFEDVPPGSFIRVECGQSATPWTLTEDPLFAYFLDELFVCPAVLPIVDNQPQTVCHNDESTMRSKINGSVVSKSLAGATGGGALFCEWVV